MQFTEKFMINIKRNEKRVAVCSHQKHHVLYFSLLSTKSDKPIFAPSLFVTIRKRIRIN